MRSRLAPFAVALAACSASPEATDADFCRPGDAVECGCPGGWASTQVCNQSGTALEACACGAATGGAAGGGGGGGQPGSGGSGATVGGAGGYGGVPTGGSGGGAAATGGTTSGGGAGGSAGSTGGGGGGGGTGGASSSYWCLPLGPQPGCASKFAYQCTFTTTPATYGAQQCQQPSPGYWCCATDVCTPNGSTCPSAMPPKMYACASSTSLVPPGCTKYVGYYCCP